MIVTTLPNAADWLVAEDSLDPASIRSAEALFTVGNGRFATRGSFEERYPGDQPATLAHGVWAPHPIAVSELANLPDWTSLDIHVDGARFSLADGEILRYWRMLDLRSGLLRRNVTWRSPSGVTVELGFERFASLADARVAGVRLTVTTLDHAERIEVHAGLDARVDTDGRAHLEPVAQAACGRLAELTVAVRGSQTRVALATSVRVSSEAADIEAWNPRGRPTIVASWLGRAGQTVTIDKVAVLAMSHDATDPAEAVATAIGELEGVSFDTLFDESAAAWRRAWDKSDVVIEGDPVAQLAIRFALYHLTIAAPTEGTSASIGAKTLSGFGYHGHVFWDTETFMLPWFVHNHPGIARRLLSYRYDRLDGARRKARAGGFDGAQFPWESAGTGDEVTPTLVPDAADRTRIVRIWTGDIELHISAIVAHAVMNYWTATGDDAFMVDEGAELVVETARFWASRLEWNAAAERYELRDVIGPDENHDHVDNNAFTNYLAAWHLRTAADVAAWLGATDGPRADAVLGSPDKAQALIDRLRKAAAQVYLPIDPATGLIEQFDGYFGLRELDLAAYADRDRSMQSLLGIEGVAETTVIKQPDVMMLAYLLPELFDPATLATNFAYYDPRTDHEYGSSLGPAIQAVLATRVGRIDEAYRHFVRAAHIDLGDDRGNGGEGIHGAALGGLWQAVVFGFAGVRFDGDAVTTDPRLPEHWTRLAFRLVHRGRVVDVDLRREARVPVRGLIFDLDGVLADTAEAHYQAWQRLADEEGLPFDRAANEALRGVSRAESLRRLLGARSVPPGEAEALMARKNAYYRELIARLGPDDLLPGAESLIEQARAHGLKVALASSSRNALEVVERLGIADRFDARCDGSAASAAKPAPDLFLAAAAALGLPPSECVTFEDAADGIEAAHAAGMLAVGIGPVERAGAADVRLDELADIDLDEILEALVELRAAAA
jgi:kojibiose phosphorylase